MKKGEAVKRGRREASLEAPAVIQVGGDVVRDREELVMALDRPSLMNLLCGRPGSR